MTIFYFKSNGDIYSACTGTQDINIFFGEHSNDLKLILDSVVLTNDDYVLRNIRQFKIDITKTPVELVMLPQANNYKMATS